MDVTASNFGKAADDLSREDKMAGVFNLVYQAIGTVAVMASRQCNLKDIVFTGQLTDLKECRPPGAHQGAGGEIRQSFSLAYCPSSRIPAFFNPSKVHSAEGLFSR